MLYPVINLDGYMTAFAALERMARYGLWMDPRHPAAQPWIQENAEAAEVPFDEMATMLARNPEAYRVAIRRQWYASILWYPRKAIEVLGRCTDSDPKESVINALALNEPDSEMPTRRGAGGKIRAHGLVLDGATPIGVNVPMQKAKRRNGGGSGGIEIARTTITRSDDTFAPASVEYQVNYTGGVGGGGDGGGGGGGGGGWGGGDLIGGNEIEISRAPSERFPQEEEIGAAAIEPPPVSAWPRIESPRYVPADHPFTVTVGFAKEKVAGVSGGQVRIPRKKGERHVEIDVDLMAEGLVAAKGWTRKLKVDLEDPAAGEVEFELRATEPKGPEAYGLTTLEVRYLREGTVCGFATRPLIVGPAGVHKPDIPEGYGTAWGDETESSSEIDFTKDPHVADLTLEIVKPDRDATNGRFVGKLYSRHQLKASRAPFKIDLGMDAKTFAKETVEQVRQQNGRMTLNRLLMSRARRIGQKLPEAFYAALREVAQKVAPDPPTVLIVSAEQFVPWELARIDPPLDAKRPPVLGAQAIVGRWLRDTAAAPSPKPALKPLPAMGVKGLAVMIGRYSGDGGLKMLKFAEQEAKHMEDTYQAVLVEATDEGLEQVLSANVPPIGTPGAVHFAGHGEFDPNRVDSSVLYLSDGTPMDSELFGEADYGGENQPLIFMNACMIGIGGEVLGSAGGFPGNCLRGGFGAFVGALWEVDDQVAHDVALEFWKRALPANHVPGEAVGSVLRELRGNYAPKPNVAPVSTYLAYVYYGHPRLTLRMAKE